MSINKSLFEALSRDKTPQNANYNISNNFFYFSLLLFYPHKKSQERKRSKIVDFPEYIYSEWHLGKLLLTAEENREDN